MWQQLAVEWQFLAPAEGWGRPPGGSGSCKDDPRSALDKG